MLGLAPGAHALPMLEWPLQDPVNQGIYVMNYVDQDSGAGLSDYFCDGAHTYDGHRGTDFSVYSFRAMDQGTWVIAAAAGTVTSTRFSEFDRNYETPYQGDGNFVRVMHDDGSVALYWHLLRWSVAVEPGERVERGQRLGLIGSSGSSPIPHLHFETWDNGAPADPFAGPCNPGSSAWRSQVEHAGEQPFRFMAAGLTDRALPLSPGTYQGHRGIQVLKDTPLRAVQVSEHAAAINVWVHFQALAGTRFKLQLLDPSSAIAWEREVTVNQRRRYAWRLERLQTTQLGAPLAQGQWRYRVVHDGSTVHEQAFEVGAQSRYPPRFYPLAGRAVRLGTGVQHIPLEVEGATAGDVRLIPLALPADVSLQGNQLLVGANAQLERRVHQAMIVATDADGLWDTFVLHFIDPRSPVDSTWAEIRPDRLSPALNGSWFNPETAGQGFFLEFFEARNLLFGAWFAFGLDAQLEATEPDWLVATGQPQRNRGVLDLLRVSGGRLLNPADTAEFSPIGSVGTLAMVINGCTAQWVSDFRDRGLRIADPGLQRLLAGNVCSRNAPENLSDVARHIDGNWFDPAINGQGLMLEYVESTGQVFGNWFTFDENGRRTWFVVFGDFHPEVTVLDVLRVPSGELQQPGSGEEEPAGVVELTWGQTCGEASLVYQAPGQAVLESQLVKIGPSDCSG